MIDLTWGDTITFRLYDSDEFNFVTLWFMDSGDYLWYNDGGEGKIATPINLNETFEYKAIIDLESDNYDIYFNGSKVVDDSSFTNEFVNIQNLKWIKFTSNEGHFILDNLKIFGSSSEGTPIVPDEDLEETLDTDKRWCDLFFKNQPVCSSDDDCESGVCLVNNKCASFDFTYCDEHNMLRTNKCLVSAMAFCMLSSTGDIILDNFFLFLILLILLMGFVYLMIMLRSK